MTYTVSGGTLNPTHSLTHCDIQTCDAISHYTWVEWDNYWHL